MRGAGLAAKYFMWIALGLCAVLLAEFNVLVVKNGDLWISSGLNGHLQTESARASKGRLIDREGGVWPSRADDARAALLAQKDTEQAQTEMDAIYHSFFDPAYGVAQLESRRLFGMKDKFSGFTGLSRLETRKGYDVTLTLSSSLTIDLFQALRATGASSAAAIVGNYATGEILAYTNLPSVSVGTALVSPYAEDYDRKEAWMLNRVLRVTYQPGSIQKIATALAAIRYKADIGLPDLNRVIFTCEGQLEMPGGGTIYCENGRHGDLTFTQAFARSCNCAFAMIADQLGPERLMEMCEELGYNQSLTFMDKTIDQQSRFELPPQVTSFALGWSGAGQGVTSDVQLQTLPYHMLLLTGAIANGGQARQPYAVKDVVTRDGGKIVIPERKPSYVSGKTLALDAVMAADARALMESVCGENGTAAALGSQMKSMGFTAAAKTGTAEFDVTARRLDGQGYDFTRGFNSWIVCFVKEIPVAMVVAAQNPSSQSAAVNVAREILPKAIEVLR
ncbi:MAG: hypothetical protein LBT44_09065 [Clostridiales bacterium]|jgi:peptidoglycan glycosyltransferase|nr:hypothetical protein [Clostridiales bacterium]